MKYFDFLLPILEHYSLLGYSLVFILSFLKSFVLLGIVIPGTTLIVLLGFLSSQGFFHIGTLFAFSTVGAIAGDTLSFYLGRHSERLFKPGSRIFRLSYLEKGKSFFTKYGSRSIFFSHFVSPLRPVVPFVAGMCKMDKKKFAFYDISSIMIWSAAYLLLGYFFGQAWQTVSVWSNRLSTVVFWLALFLFIFYSLKWLFIKKGKFVFWFLLSLIISIAKGIKDNPSIRSFFGRHPVLASFLKKRFDRTKFSGLMLTILSLVAIYAVGGFISVATDVFVSRNALDIDESLANLLHTFRDPLFVKIFLWITLLGRWQIALATVAAVTAVFWLNKKKNYIVPFLVSVGGGLVTGTLAKYIWQRPRPVEVAVYTETSWSFPSSHAILAVTLYGFLAYFLWRYFRKWKNKINALFFGFLVIFFIGFSRLYLGVHYFSDVWAGYMIGLFWLTIGIGLVEFKGRNKTINSEQAKRSFSFSVAAVVCLVAVIYIGYGLTYKPLLNLGIEEVAVHQVSDDRVDQIFADYKLPKFTETLLGNPQEPFSFIMVADSDEQLMQAFQKAGWFLADGVNFNSLVTTFKFEVLNKAYPTAPISPYFWQTFTNDFGFQEPTEVNSARYRHHARFWRTNFTTASGRNVYVGITSLDMGIKWWGITHRIKPDVDSEREYLFNALNSAGTLSTSSKEQFVDPVLGTNFTGDQFFTDGKAYLLELK